LVSISPPKKQDGLHFFIIIQLIRHVVKKQDGGRPIRNLLHNPAYNPGVVTWVDEPSGCFKVTSTTEFAKTWGKMKSNRYTVLKIQFIYPQK
jgi:hypothetical protein